VIFNGCLGDGQLLFYFLCLFFFFQAEDGIRDKLVTGVQTCALPIFRLSPMRRRWLGRPPISAPSSAPTNWSTHSSVPSPMRLRRSEERRVGKECRSRGAPDH